MQKYFFEDTFTAEDVKVLQNTATRMKKALDYVDLALRQGIIGYASSLIEDEETFKEMLSQVPNLKIKTIYKSGDTLGGRNNLVWLNIILEIR